MPNQTPKAPAPAAAPTQQAQLLAQARNAYEDNARTAGRAAPIICPLSVLPTPARGAGGADGFNIRLADNNTR